MVVLTQTLFVWAVAFIFSDHKGKYFHRPEDVSSVNGCFSQNSVFLGSLFHSIGSSR